MIVRVFKRLTGRRLIPCQSHWRSLSLGMVLHASWMMGWTEAQTPRHPLYSTVRQPPGAIAQQQLLRGRGTQGYYQPVHVRVPEGASIALGTAGGFEQIHAGEILAGMLIGPVYRLRVADIPFLDGVRLYPTLEIIDRLYPPAGFAQRYPIVVDITKDDLAQAAAGTLVTRVVYLENPDTPAPNTQPYREEQPYFDVLPSEDPLHVADELGRPMAILRIGSRTLDEEDGQVCDLGVPCAPSLLLNIEELHRARFISDSAAGVLPNAGSVPGEPRPLPEFAPVDPMSSEDGTTPSPAQVPLESPMNPTPHDAALPSDVGHDSPLTARPVLNLRRKITR